MAEGSLGSSGRPKRFSLGLGALSVVVVVVVVVVVAFVVVVIVVGGTVVVVDFMMNLSIFIFCVRSFSKRGAKLIRPFDLARTIWGRLMVIMSASVNLGSFRSCFPETVQNSNCNRTHYTFSNKFGYTWFSWFVWSVLSFGCCQGSLVDDDIPMKEIAGIIALDFFSKVTNHGSLVETCSLRTQEASTTSS